MLSQQLTHFLCRETSWKCRFLGPALPQAGESELSSPCPLNLARKPEGSGRGGGPNVTFLISSTAEMSMHDYHTPKSINAIHTCWLPELYTKVTKISIGPEMFFVFLKGWSGHTPQPGLEGAHLRWAFTPKCLGASSISAEYPKAFTGNPNRLLTSQPWKQEALHSR